MAWVSPTGEVLNGWTGAGLAWDEDTATSSTYTIPTGGTWSPYLELTHVAIQCTKVQVWSSIQNTQVDQIEVDVYYNSAWNNIYSGAITVDQWVEYAIGSEQSVTSMRIRYHSTKKGRWAGVNEADFWETVTLPYPNQYNKILYTSEPPTPNAWNQVKQEAGTGWRKLLYS